MSYKGIKGAQIKASGGKPSTNRTGVVGHVSKDVHIKSTTPEGCSGRSHWMGSGASGPKTVHEARGKHLA